jgi:hypothetical protein
MMGQTTEQQELLEKLKRDVFKSLNKGRPKNDVVDDLTRRGLAPDKAAAIVEQVALSMRQIQTENEGLAVLHKRIRRRYIDIIAAGLAIIAGNIVLTLVANWLLLPVGLTVIIRTVGCVGIATVLTGIAGFIRYSLPL